MKNLPLMLILALNIIVFIGWNYINSETQLTFMVDNFLVSWVSVFEGRPWTLLTSVFSHASTFHLLFNMMALMSFSSVMLTILGPLSFTTFYLIAGLAGSVAHIVSSAYLIHDPAMKALGASGAVSGIILLFSLLFPQQRLLIMGIIPVRAIWGAVGLMGLDVWGLVNQTKGGGFAIGHGAHLGGAVIGIIYYFFVKRRFKARASALGL